MSDQTAPAEGQQTEPQTGSDLAGRIAVLEAQLEKESAQATEYMKRWQYAEAEIANIKRRTQQEREELQKYGTAPLAAALCEVMDNFERAEMTIPRSLNTLTWINGVILIHRQLDYLLKQHGLEAIDTTGKVFDPARHDALAEEHHATVAAGSIIATVQSGYTLHGRVLRPALVRVSKGPEPATPPPTEEPNAAGGTPATMTNASE